MSNEWELVCHESCSVCGSKNNLAVYKHITKPDLYYQRCFSVDCSNYKVFNKNNSPMQNFETVESQPQPQSDSNTFKVGRFADIPERGLIQKVCQHYGYQVIVDYEGQITQHIANYYDDSGKVVGQQIRQIPKNFYAIGTITDQLFGRHKFPKGSGSFIVVTEGPIDCLTIAQLYDCKYPVVSIPSGAAGAARCLAKNIKYLESFEKVILCFDADEAGLAAAHDCARILTPGKCHIAELPRKDANELLMHNETDLLRKILWNTKPYTPQGLIHDGEEIELEEFENILDKGVDIKFPQLSAAIGGLRQRHLYTICAREKAGKSTFTKELVLDLLSKGQNVGLLYLEEAAASALASLVAMNEGIPFYKLKDGVLGDAQELKLRSEQFLKDNKLCIYDHKGRFSPDVLLSQIRFMAVGLGAKYIILDNISISIAGTASVSERQLIDKFVSDLVALIQDTGVTVVNVVHLIKNRKITKGSGDDKESMDDEYLTRADIHGSGSFSKFSHVVIGLQRDNRMEDLSVLKILANRDMGIEGITDYLKYDHTTGRLGVTEINDSGLTFGTEDDKHFDF